MRIIRNLIEKTVEILVGIIVLCLAIVAWTIVVEALAILIGLGSFLGFCFIVSIPISKVFFPAHFYRVRLTAGRFLDHLARRIF